MPASIHLPETRKQTHRLLASTLSIQSRVVLHRERITVMARKLAIPHVACSECHAWREIAVLTPYSVLRTSGLHTLQ